MSIQSVELKIVVCDRCGSVFYSEVGESAFPDDETAEEAIDDQPDRYWEKLDGKHYCSDCYELDENENVIVKEDESTDKF